MRLPILVTAVVATGGVLLAPLHAGASQAHPRPVPITCNLVTDPTGDATYNHVPGNPTDDLVGADVATNATTLTGVIRLAGLSAVDPMWPLGHGYFVLFSVKGYDSVFFLSARTFPQGAGYFFGYQAPDPTSGINTSYTVAPAVGLLDTVKNEVRISIPLATIASTVNIKKGVRMSGFEAQSFRILGQGLVPSQSVAGSPRVPVGGLLLQFDDALSTRKYYAGAPSCVKPVS